MGAMIDLLWIRYTTHSAPHCPPMWTKHFAKWV